STHTLLLIRQDQVSRFPNPRQTWGGVGFEDLGGFIQPLPVILLPQFLVVVPRQEGLGGFVLTALPPQAADDHPEQSAHHLHGMVHPERAVNEHAGVRSPERPIVTGEGASALAGHRSLPRYACEQTSAIRISIALETSPETFTSFRRSGRAKHSILARNGGTTSAWTGASVSVDLA